jgi:hypothetical protein
MVIGFVVLALDEDLLDVVDVLVEEVCNTGYCGLEDDFFDFDFDDDFRDSIVTNDESSEISSNWGVVRFFLLFVLRMWM